MAVSEAAFVVNEQSGYVINGCEIWVHIANVGQQPSLDSMISTARASSLMIWHYLDPDALKVRYTVWGRPEFPVLHREFLGVQCLACKYGTLRQRM